MKKQPSRIAKIDYGIHLFFFFLLMIFCLMEFSGQEIVVAIIFFFTGLYQTIANFFKLFTVKGPRRKQLHLYCLLSIVYLGLFFVLAVDLVDGDLPTGVYLLFVIAAFCLSLFSLYISYKGAFKD